MLRHTDLCSGIGGFSLGFQWAGLSEPVLFCDTDAWCRKVLAKHWPDVPIAEDVKELASDPARLVPDCDILTAGYPCQPFSVAGNQRGTEDDRHIWPEIFKIIQAKRPTWIVCENVSGHISLGLNQVLSDLEDQAGYAVQTFCVGAVSVNAPHRRQRIFIIANTDNTRQSASSRRGKNCGNKSRHNAGRLRQNVGNAAYNGRNSGAAQAQRKRAAHQSGQSQSGLWSKSFGSSKNVADTDSNGTEWSKPENREGSGVVKNSANVAYTDNKRSQGRLSGGKDAERQSEHGHTRCSSAVHRQPTEEWWAAEPSVGRVANGIPKRVDRLKGLGNAIVPQIAMRIGQTIKAVHYG